MRRCLACSASLRGQALVLPVPLCRISTRAQLSLYMLHRHTSLARLSPRPSACSTTTRSRARPSSTRRTRLVLPGWRFWRHVCDRTLVVAGRSRVAWGGLNRRVCPGACDARKFACCDARQHSIAAGRRCAIQFGGQQSVSKNTGKIVTAGAIALVDRQHSFRVDGRPSCPVRGAGNVAGKEGARTSCKLMEATIAC
jgi:hypothetical protein